MINNKKVKLFVTYHKPAPLLKGEMFVPMNGGRANLQKKYLEGKISDFDYNWLLNNTIGDDSGDNISKDNSRYNEMSVVYWAWKNLDKLYDPDYVGLMHYRRHFIFKDWFMPEDNKWSVDFPVFDSNYVGELNCCDEVVQEYLNKYDCLYAYYQAEFSVYYQYANCTSHNIEDLDYILSVIENDYPDIYPSAKKYVDGYNHYFCNMFVFKKDLFNQYCEFVFAVLSKYDKWRNDLSLSEIEKRFFISERITGIFIQYLIDTNQKCCPLNISYLKNTDVKQDIYPAFQENNVPVVFFTDDNYVQYLVVALTSLLEHIKKSCNYDIFILFNSLSEANKKKIKNIFKSIDNASVRFIDVTPYLSDDSICQFSQGTESVTLSNFYSFLVSDIFKNYRKIVCLHADIIVNKDIAELYNQNIENNWIGASLDIKEILNLRLNEKKRTDIQRKDYLINTLGLEEPYKYFQDGALIINIEQFNKNNVKSKLIDSLRQYPDTLKKSHDILNSVCSGHVYFFPVSWNLDWQIEFEYPEYEILLPTSLYEQYLAGTKNSNIVHYASQIKPWYEPEKNLAGLWWSYARKTGGYEFFLAEMVKHKLEPTFTSLKTEIKNIQKECNNQKEKVVSLKSVIETILSLKNSEDKSHKILTILGVKFKFAK